MSYFGFGSSIREWVDGALENGHYAMIRNSYHLSKRHSHWELVIALG